MTSVPSVEPDRLPTRWRLSLRTLFWLQVLVSPAFLAPVYSNIQAHHPYVGLVAVLVAPVLYVGMLTGGATQPTTGKRRYVFRFVRSGALFGILFCVLALGPLAIYAIASYVVEFVRIGMPLGMLGRAFLEVTLVAGFVLLHYLLIGGAAGGVVGLVRDWLATQRFSLTLNPKPCTLNPEL